MRILRKRISALSLFFTLFTVFPAIITFAQEIQTGDATWYADDSLDLHASHARLPLGTRLQVTNMNNQREVYVTVTGRLQNGDSRILDISQEAAMLLDMNETGSTPISLLVMGSVSATEPVPEITAVSVSPDEEEYQDDLDGNPDKDSPAQIASAETPSSPPPPVRAFPQQPAPQAQPRQPAPQAQPRQPAPQAQPRQPAQAADQVLLKKIVVLINGKEQTIDIPDGVYIPLSDGQAPSAHPTPQPPAYSAPPPVYTPYPPAPSRVYIQTAPVQTAPAPARPAPAQPASPVPVQPATPAIKVIPNLPDPQSGKVYRIQVGAFSQAALAQVCFDRLRAAGFSPAFEQNGNLYRVVLSGIRAADASNAARRLNAAGFTEVWIREESRP